MRIFVAGITGTLGQPVARSLRERGHEVVGLTRSKDRGAGLEPLGVRMIVGDALVADVLRDAVVDSQPEVVVHLLTALPPGGALRPRQLRLTNALRVTATAHLLRAAVAARSRRVVAESFIGVYGSTALDHSTSEDEPLPPIADGPMRDSVTALRSLEDQLHTVRDAGSIDTVALRLGFLYGPGVPSTTQLITQARRRRLFVPRHLSGVGAFVHIIDAVAAIVAAIERPYLAPVYNVVDDEPVALSAFLECLAGDFEVPPPRPVPAWLVRLAAPTLAEMASARLLLDNAKATRDLDWSLRYPTVRDGLIALARSEPSVAANR